MDNLTCPICDGPMVSRANKSTGQRFWGCKEFPECRGTRNTDGESPQEAQTRKGERPSRPDDDEGLPSDQWRDRDRRRW